MYSSIVLWYCTWHLVVSANSRGSLSGGVHCLSSSYLYAWYGPLIFYIGNHRKSCLNSRFLHEGPKDPKNRYSTSDPVNVTKYTACHHGADGKIEYWQGVPKAREIGHTSSYMHKEEVRCIACAFGTCIEAVVATSSLSCFFSLLLIVIPDNVQDGNLLFRSYNHALNCQQMCRILSCHTEGEDLTHLLSL
jgi:hypothetical protein